MNVFESTSEYRDNDDSCVECHQLMGSNSSCENCRRHLASELRWFSNEVERARAEHRGTATEILARWKALGGECLLELEQIAPKKVIWPEGIEPTDL